MDVESNEMDEGNKGNWNGWLQYKGGVAWGNWGLKLGQLN